MQAQRHHSIVVHMAPQSHLRCLSTSASPISLHLNDGQAPMAYKPPLADLPAVLPPTSRASVRFLFQPRREEKRPSPPVMVPVGILAALLGAGESRGAQVPLHPERDSATKFVPSISCGASAMSSRPIKRRLLVDSHLG